MKNILLLGATGSIGTQVLDIIRNNDKYCLKAFSFGNNIEKAKIIIQEFHPKLVCAMHSNHIEILKQLFPNVNYCLGDIGLQKIASFDEKNTIVVNALVGAVGLIPTIVAIENGKDVLLANKETLVIGGKIVTQLAKAKNVQIIPIDSEHSAIYQLLHGVDKKDIKRLYITASGGALRDKDREELKEVTKKEALHHPNWKMGDKITIDCATMINKGFELIEACYLFDLDIDNVVPILHRESIIHSMVEFQDGSVFAQMATSDMHLPIQYALEYPRHLANQNLGELDLIKIGSLHFEKVSFERYPLVKCAIDAYKKGKLQCTILNAANEAAVQLFLKDKIKFFEIEKIIFEALENPQYQGFNEGDVNVTKIMSLHQLVYNEIYYKYC